MIKIDIVSGFLGAGKTTLIRKLIKEELSNEKIVLIENEFGEIGIDSGFLKDCGIEIKEMNSGCICCSLVGDFATSLQEVIKTYHPDRIIIEPSGVGKLSDVIKAIRQLEDDNELCLNSKVAVVDAVKAKMYCKNFGEFYVNQIEHANTIILSRTGIIDESAVVGCVELLRTYNKTATIITTPWELLNSKKIVDAIEGKGKLEEQVTCTCGCHHEHEDSCHEESCHEHSCHEHSCHEHECNENHEHQGHHHHADEIFSSWGIETPKVYKKKQLENILQQLRKEEEFGMVLRAKGMVPTEDGTWIYFDYVPEETSLKDGEPDYTGKVCVIGTGLLEHKLELLFS